ncbi:DUF2971 domain-containing protein [Spirosoma endbachense]|uniref:DUF2971 domain-containing protein n=1 Tax=Spirosoma endbachense TaxID=2666025 RepID=A0A6P1W1M4_9BACT|nr:DUF2971 domain-containing protein [Spirosoma endbachense]QHV99313.1 DUF2971 domain-containing protein [Spirosoma endbachense]
MKSWPFSSFIRTLDPKLTNNPKLESSLHEDNRLYVYHLPPPVIYHYASLGTSKAIVEGQQLKLSSPKTFNDPFDMNPSQVSFKATAKEVKAYQERIKTSLYNSINREAKRRLIREMANPANANEYQKLNTEQMYNEVGVCCFSKLNDQPLMWSHYAEKHYGICLGFSIQPLYQTQNLFFSVSEVQYVSEIRPLNYYKDIEELMPYLINTKSKVWEYEQEVRAVIDNRQGFDLFPFERDCLKEIYFGCRVSKEERTAFIKLVNEHKYNISTYRKMIIDFKTFNVKAVKL